MTRSGENQAQYESAALQLLRRPEVRAAVADQAARWRAGTPGLLPETYDQLAASIEEVVLLVALQVVNSDPRRPGIVEISAGPHRGDGFDVPVGAGGSTIPTRSTSRRRSSRGRRTCCAVAPAENSRPTST